MARRPESTSRNIARTPAIGVTCDVADERAVARLGYAKAVMRAGATPVFLPPIVELAEAHAALFDGFVLTGGDDPLMEAFGEPTHPLATPVDPARQAYELALLDWLEHDHPNKPVLGVCLGMQFMALHAGGRLNQHMPDDVPTHESHRHDKAHNVRPVVPDSPIAPGLVTSHHKQAVRDAGSMRVVAVAEDGVVEAIDDAGRPFYLGVQWHPERTLSKPLGQELFDRLVARAR